MKKHKFGVWIYLLIFSLACNVNAIEFFSQSTLWALEFEKDMGGAEKYTFAEFSLALKNGTLEGRYVESKPYMELNAFENPISADEIESIDVRISSQNDMMLKFYFATDKEPGWSEERAFYILPAGGSEMNEYSIKTSGIKNWGNNITQFRMDFKGTDGDYATNELNLDYIRVLGAEGNSAQKTEDGIIYDFEKNSKTDGWKFNAENSEAIIANGTISYESDGLKTLETCGLESISAKDIGNISITLKNETSTDKAQLYFANVTGGEYEKRFEFDIVPNDSNFRTYSVVTGKNENWTGDINGLKFDFGNEPGKITVDEIILRKYPYQTTFGNGTVNVTGTAKEAVSLQISKRNESLENYSEAVIYTDETKADSDGNFRFECVAPQTSEPVKLVVAVAVDGILYNSGETYVPDGYAEVIRQKYNEAVLKGDALSASGIITECYEYLGINAPGYEEYVSAYDNKESFGKQLIRYGMAESSEILKNNISNAAVFVMLTESDKNTAVKIAKKYDDIIGLSQNSVYGIYSGYENDEKAEILEAACADAEDTDDIKTAFAEKTILYGISFTIGTDAVKTIIHNNKNIIGIDISGEQRLNNPERIYAELAGNLYNSYTDLKNAYNTAFEKCETAEKAAESNSSSSSGGGGKSSSSGGATVPVIPSVSNAKTKIFGDLKDFEWAEESIEKLYEKGIISGKSEGYYMPADNVSRAEFIKMLTVALGISQSSDIPFKDVAKDSWYREYIEKAYAAGIILGTSDGTFAPEERISRQDMAVIIYRAAKSYFNSDAEIKFTDSADAAEYAIEAVKALNAAGIINGMPDGSFMPESFATRAQTAVIIERLMKHMGKI